MAFLYDEEEQYQTPINQPPIYQTPIDNFSQMFYRPTVESSMPEATPDATRQGFGVARTPFAAEAQAASNSALTHQQKAMALMRQAIAGGNGVSDEQATAAAVRGLIPALGGALLGGLMGSPNLSPHSKFSMQDLQGSPTGISGGLQMGVVAGEKDSNEYLKDLKAQQAKTDAVNMAMAKNEFEQGTIEQRQANELTAGGLNKEAQLEINRQNNKDTGDRQIQLEQKRFEHERALKGLSSQDPNVAKVAAALAAVGGDASKLPMDIKAVALTSKEGRAMLASGDKLGGDLGMTPEEKINFQKKLVDSVSRLDMSKKYADLSATYYRAINLAKQTDPASAIAYVETFGKSLVPGFALREFATKLAEKAPGPQQEAIGAFQAYAQGKGALTDKAREGMFTVIREAFKSYGDVYQSTVEPYRATARMAGIDPMIIVPKYEDPWNEVEGGKTGDPAEDPEFQKMLQKNRQAMGLQ